MERLDTALDCSNKIFGTNSFKKALTNDGYERRMNRAIFDALTRSFSDAAIADIATANQTLVIELFREACTNPEFKAAIEKSTKTLAATALRINYWSEKLAKAIGRAYDADSMRIQ